MFSTRLQPHSKGKAQQLQSQAPQHPRLEARSPPQREALVRAPAGRTCDGDRVSSSVSDRLCKVPALSHVCWHGDAGLRAHCPLASGVPVSTLTGTVHVMTKEPFPVWPQFWACVSAQDTTSTAPSSPLLRRYSPNLGVHWCLAHIRLCTELSFGGHRRPTSLLCRLSRSCLPGCHTIYSIKQ